MKNRVLKRTNSLFAKLIQLTIETGLVPTTGDAALIELVLAVALQVTIYHIALFYIISKSEVTWSYLRSTDEFSTNTISHIEQRVDRHKTVALYEDRHSSARSRSRDALETFCQCASQG
ncbi:hypothetical protein BDR06DRAFT_953892 [Suillus hirtellus]|nr:hypothetical protein BDR06DRAFT_953892 [Suillus hirtellus]